MTAVAASVTLVVPPFLALTRPSLGVSALKASLTRAGVPARVHYLCLDFAAQVGPGLAHWIAEFSNVRLLLGEWVFRHTLFPTRPAADLEAYLRLLEPNVPDEILSRLPRARRLASAFVRRAARRIVEERPDIVGFSSSFQQNCAALAIAREVKQLVPHTPICFGGANCEGGMGRSLLRSFPQIDFVFSGEADLTFPDFVQRWAAGERPPATGSTVFSRESDAGSPGGALVAIGRGSGEADSAVVEDLDELPIPDFSDYFTALAAASFADRVEPALLFESSRGCWWGAKRHCKFCGLNGHGMAYRAKSATRVLEELRVQSARWGIRRYEAVDNILAMQHVKTIFGELAASDAGYRFFYEIKSNMNHQQLLQIARGGVTWVQPGVESLHDDLLRSMDKGVTALQNVRQLRDASEIGITCIWNLLVGFPGETEAHYRRMEQLGPLLEHLIPPTGCARIRLDRFSPFFERAAELGFSDVRPTDAYRHVYDLDAQALSGIAYFFEGTTPGPSAAAFRSLVASVDRWRKRYYSGERPVLALLDIGGLSVVRDTRTIARQEWHSLDRHETGLLQAFRDPCNVERTLAAVDSRPRSPASTAGIFGDLVERGFILVDGERAVSLVVEFGWRVHGGEEFPGGRYLGEHRLMSARVAAGADRATAPLAASPTGAGGAGVET